MDVVQSNKFGIGDDFLDVFEDLPSLMPHMVVSIRNHGWSLPKSVGDFENEFLLLVFHFGDVVVLYMAPSEEFDQRNGDSRLTATKRSHWYQNQVVVHFLALRL